MSETIREESIPPDKNAPNGTSAMDCSLIASIRADSMAVSASISSEKTFFLPDSIASSKDQYGSNFKEFKEKGLSKSTDGQLCVSDNFKLRM